MFDPALLQTLEMPLPPAPPMSGYERPWQTRQAEQVQKLADRLAAAYENYVRDWRSRVDAVRQASTAIPLSPFTLEEARQLDELIEEVEQFAESKAIVSARLAKRVARDVKRQFQTDASLAAVTRSLGSRISAADQEIIEEVLDYALFLRAFRAERSPLARGGRTFGDLADLARYLDSTLA